MVAFRISLFSVDFIENVFYYILHTTPLSLRQLKTKPKWLLRQVLDIIFLLFFVYKSKFNLKSYILFITLQIYQKLNVLNVYHKIIMYPHRNLRLFLVSMKIKFSICSLLYLDYFFYLYGIYPQMGNKLNSYRD